MATIHLPGDKPKPETATDPERVPLVQLAGRSSGVLSSALARVVAAGAGRSGPGRVAVAAFQSAL